jgi:hypothetical protein
VNGLTQNFFEGMKGSSLVVTSHCPTATTDSISRPTEQEVIQAAVCSCFSSLSSVVGWDVGELWSLDPSGLSLLHVFVDGEANKDIANYFPVINEYHFGTRRNRASRSLCKRASRSRRGFYWRSSKRSVVVDSEVPFRSAMAFHMPRDNINGDVFVALFSLRYLMVS